MSVRPLLLSLVALSTLSACGGGSGDSSWKPWRWFGGGSDRGPGTLEPKGGYASQDGRELVGQVLTARLEPTDEGRLLVVTGLADQQGWWDIALETATPQPPGRLRPDSDGVLRLKLVGNPPIPGSPASMRPARPGADTVTVALALTTQVMGRIARIEVAGARNGITLKR